MLRGREQTKLLVLSGAFAVVTAVAIVLRVIEPPHDPAELDGDPDGEWLNAVGFAIYCILALSAYGLLVAALWRRLNRLPTFVSANVCAMLASRVFDVALIGGAIFALTVGVESLVFSNWWVVVTAFAIVGIASAKIRRAGGLAWSVGVVVGALVGVYLELLYGLATP